MNVVERLDDQYYCEYYWEYYCQYYRKIPSRRSMCIVYTMLKTLKYRQ